MSAEAATIQAIRPVQSRRFALNLVTNVGNLGLSMVVGVLYVPFLVRHLGPAVYGLIPLTSLVTSYMALITVGLDSAVARYLTIALERKDHENANLIFNVSLWGNLALSALLVIPAAAAIAQVDHILRIPPGYEAPTRWLFVGMVAAFLLNQVKTPFGVSSFCRNRLDLLNLVAASETLARVGLVVCLFCIFTPTMYHIYARGDIDGLVVYLNRAIKFVGLVMALCIGLICGFSEPLLRLWLGPAFCSLASLLFLMAIHLCMSLSMYPLYALPLAANRVKVPGVATLAIGVVNLLLALFMVWVLGWGMYGLASAGAITLTVRHLLFTPLYGARVLNQPYGTFLRGGVPIVLA